MNTVFTNDAKYLSARDELLAVYSLLHRKQHQKMIQKGFSFVRLNNVWMPTSTLWFRCSTIAFPRLLVSSW